LHYVFSLNLYKLLYRADKAEARKNAAKLALFKVAPDNLDEDLFTDDQPPAEVKQVTQPIV
jgi:hypothetical protein